MMQTPWINNREMGAINSRKNNKVMRFSIKKALLGYISEMKDDLEKAEAVIEENLMDETEKPLPSLEENEGTNRQEELSLEKNNEMKRNDSNLSPPQEVVEQKQLSVETIPEKKTGTESPRSDHKVKTKVEVQEPREESTQNHDLRTSGLETTVPSVRVRIPVILGNYDMEICIEDEEGMKDKIKEISNIATKVELTKCRFTPVKISPVLDDGPCKVLSGHLLLAGVIKQDITYVLEKKPTSNYALNQMTSNLMYLQKLHNNKYTQPYLIKKKHSSFGKPSNHSKVTEQYQQSISKTIPFNSMVTIDHFLHSPLVGPIDNHSFLFPVTSDNEEADSEIIQFRTAAYYPDSINSKLIYSKINDNINLEKKHKKINLKQYIVLELSIQLIQEQLVHMQALSDEFKSPLSY